MSKEIVQKVERILHNKKLESHTDTIELEREIDQLVYRLYGLTEEEIQVVEAAGE